MRTRRPGPLALTLGAATIMTVACGGTEFSGGTDGGGTGGLATSGSGGPTGSSTGSSGGSSGDSQTGGSAGVGGSATTAGSGTGGGSTGGGGGGTGGSGSGGSGGTCGSDSVTFRLVPGGLPGSPGYCVGSCGTSWVTIKTADGQVLGGIDHGCFASCTDCSPVLCPAIACPAPHHLASSGENITWNGTLWAANTCSQPSGAKLPCVNPVCVSPGSSLVATMCAYPNMTPDGGTYCAGGPTPKCVDVPFIYPTTTVVTGVLDPTR